MGGMQTGAVAIAPPPALGTVGGVRVEGAEAEQRRVEHRLAGLAGHVLRCFQEADLHRAQFIQSDLLECQRRYEGEYEPGFEAELRAAGEEPVYDNLTRVKCNAAKAKLKELMTPDSSEQPWMLLPTPIPELDEEAQGRVMDVVQAYYDAHPELLATPESVREVTNDAYDAVMDALIEVAEERATRMERLIRDQLAEAQFIQALHEWLHYFVIYPSAVLAGPFPTMQKREKWNGTQLVIEKRVVNTFHAVSPHDFYPSPNARHCNEGYMIEVITWGLDELEGMRGQPGWSDAGIDAVLDAPPNESTLGWYRGGESERAHREYRSVTNHGGVAEGSVQGLLFWGRISGRHLQAWGVQGIDPRASDDVCVVMFGRHVVYAQKNPHPLGHRPYYKASYDPTPNSFYGRAIPKGVKNSQDCANAIERSLIANAAFASGPMQATDIDILAEGCDPTPRPWANIQFNGTKLGNSTRKPVEWYQPNLNVAQLLQIIEHYKKNSDDDVSVPRFSYGNADIGGAGQTASGLSSLMDEANIGFKGVVASVDLHIIQPAIRAMYIWNMLYHPDPRVKGDCEVVPKGVLAVIERQQMKLRLMEWLSVTNNPQDTEIIGMMGRARVLREVARRMGLPQDKIIPKDEVLRARVRQQQLNQRMIQYQMSLDAQGQGERDGAMA